MARKMTFHFRRGLDGWSETYYFNRPTNSLDKPATMNVARERQKVLASDAFITYATVQDTEAPGRTENYELNINGTAGTPQANNAEIPAPADSSASAVLLPYRTASGVKRYVSLRGIPDSWFKGDENKSGITKIDANATTALKFFYKFLESAPDGLQIRLLAVPPNVAQVAIANVTKGLKGNYVVQTALAHGFQVGQLVNLTKLKGQNLCHLKGIHRITEVEGVGTTFSVDVGPMCYGPEVRFDGQGLATEVEYTYQAAARSEEGFRVSSRDVGRPFNWRHGRRSAKC